MILHDQFSESGAKEREMANYDFIGKKCDKEMNIATIMRSNQGSFGSLERIILKAGHGRI